MFAQLHNIFRFVKTRRKVQFLVLLLFTVFTSFLEIVSLGSIVPFIGILTQPEEVFNSKNFSPLITWLDINEPNQLIFPITVIFASAALFAGIFRTLLLRFGIRLSNITGADLSIDIYKKTLHQPYYVHLSRSSSEIISGLTQKVRTVTSVIESVITVITSMFLLLAILSTLIYIDPFVAIVSIASFGICYSIIAILTRKRLKKNSITVADLQTKVIKTLQEGLGSIREVLLSSSQDLYTNLYGLEMKRLLKATGENQFITLFPRFAMETAALILVAGLAYFVTRQDDSLSSSLPILGAMALAAQRLLPLLQMTYANWSNLVGNQAAIRDVLDLLSQKIEIQELKETEIIDFKESIVFKNISFKYPETDQWIFQDAELEIIKGSTIGFVGETGSGKSTCLDLLMSLLEPNQGEILVDGQQLTASNRPHWKRLISHVPQSIFLIDSTIRENIVFDKLENLDQKQFNISAKRAQASGFIENFEKKYETIAGESGARLSGGQKQRIGIARALYKESELLVLDEATSALDHKTERKVMHSLTNLDDSLTVLIIAHRISTLEMCDKIYLVKDKKFIDMGSYDKFIRTEMASSYSKTSEE